MEQIEHNKLKIDYNELQNKYNALLQNVEFIKYLDNHEQPQNGNKEFTLLYRNVHKIVKQVDPVN